MGIGYLSAHRLGENPAGRSGLMVSTGSERASHKASVERWLPSSSGLLSTFLSFQDPKHKQINKGPL